MKKITLYLLVISIIMSCKSVKNMQVANSNTFQYPITKKIDVVTNYFGKEDFNFEILDCSVDYAVRNAKNAITCLEKHFQKDRARMKNAIGWIIEFISDRGWVKSEDTKIRNRATFAYFFTPKNDNTIQNAIAGKEKGNKPINIDTLLPYEYNDHCAATQYVTGYDEDDDDDIGIESET